jgi:hypothetical protein
LSTEPAGEKKLIIKEESNIMVNAIYLMLALAAAGVIVWQLGFLFGIPNAPAHPDFTVTLSALTAAIIFFGLWLAGRVHRKEAKANLIFD